jgi:hypothetical protein
MLTLLAPSLLDPLVLSSRVAWVRLPERTSHPPASGGAGFLYSGLAFDAPDRTSLLTLFQLIGTLTF